MTEIEPKSHYRLTRRRLMKSAIVGGFGLAAAAALAPVAKADELIRKIALPLVVNGERPESPVFVQDLANDVINDDILPDWFKEKQSQPEVKGELDESYYAVETTIVRVGPRLQQSEYKEKVALEIQRKVNEWLTQNLLGRMLRFKGIGTVGLRPEIKGLTGAKSAEKTSVDIINNLHLGSPDKPSCFDFGNRQKINILFVDGMEGIALAANNVVIMSLPNNGVEQDIDIEAAKLAHLLGHSLGLSHSVDDIDTRDTEFDSGNSIMSPETQGKALNGRIILDSQLNPDKARLLYSGFLPYEGRVYTSKDGAIPLVKGLSIHGQSGEHIKISHGLYDIPCRKNEVGITICGSNSIIDLGSAIVRGSDNDFKPFGEHDVTGVGIYIGKDRTEPHGDRPENIVVRGGVISGYHYGLMADEVARLQVQGVSSINGKRMFSDVTRPDNDDKRGYWLDFWLTPSDDESQDNINMPDGTLNSVSSYGSAMYLKRCQGAFLTHNMVAHTTVGVADYYGKSNTYRKNDFSECSMGLRFWKSQGTEDKPITVVNNIFHFNTQPVPWWHSGGDGAALLGTGVANLNIVENDMAYGGDGVFMCGFPYEPGKVEKVRVENNVIRYNFAHGIELDFIQNSNVIGNTITGNWLSGIWAGHSVLAVVSNRFSRNNSGRMFAGSQDQGAISCPEGRLTIVGNSFEDQLGVAVNLWQDYKQYWWPSSGDSRYHMVNGNLFSRNGIAVRLRGIRSSDIKNNQMIDNGVDINDVGSWNNNINNNGQGIDYISAPPVVHLSHEKIHISKCDPILRFEASLIYPNGTINSIAPDFSVEYIDPENPWLKISKGSGFCEMTPNSFFTGADGARLIVSYDGVVRSIPVKYFGGEFDLKVGTNPQGELIQTGTTNITTGRTRLFTEIGEVYGSGVKTGIKGVAPFYTEISTPYDDFHLPQNAQGLLIAVLTDGNPCQILLSPNHNDVNPERDTAFLSQNEKDWPEFQSVIIPSTRTNYLLKKYHHRLTTDQEIFENSTCGMIVVPLDRYDQEIIAQSQASLASIGVVGEGSMSLPGKHKKNMLQK